MLLEASGVSADWVNVGLGVGQSQKLSYQLVSPPPAVVWLARGSASLYYGSRCAGGGRSGPPQLVLRITWVFHRGVF